MHISIHAILIGTVGDVAAHQDGLKHWPRIFQEDSNISGKTVLKNLLYIPATSIIDPLT